MTVVRPRPGGKEPATGWPFKDYRVPAVGGGAAPGIGFGGFGGPSPSGVPLFMSVGGLMRIIVPPGGFAGFAQQTPATQALFARAGARGGRMTQRRRRRKAAAAARSAPRRKRSARRRGRARLVKGSAAAKRYMAKIRRKRRR